MPISSTQMSGLVGGQQAMFGNMATYAAQISPFAPQGMAPTYTNPMAGAEFPPSMGYVPGQTEYAEAGARAPGLIGGAAAYGAPALGMAGVAMGGRVGGMLDPFTGGMRGFGRGVGWQSGAGWGANLGRVMSGGIGGIARGIGMGAVGMLPGLAIGGAIQYAGGQMMEGAQFRNQAMGFMQDQFRFSNPTTRGGYGFGQGGMESNVRMLHEMGTERMGSTPQEMLGIMQGTTSMGVYRGVRDAKEFQRKFKETVSALTEIAKTFNTTLSEAMPMFGEARRQGFWTPQDITRHAQQVRQVQATTGLSTQQAQQYTAMIGQSAQAIGGSAQQGSMMGARSLSLAGAATYGGTVSAQQLQNAGMGMGAEATTNLAAMMGGMTSRFAASRVGRWTLAAMMGRNGNLDPEQMEKFARGEMGVGAIQRMAERNVGGAGTTGRPGGAMQFVENEEELRGQFAARGPEMVAGAIKGLAGGSLYGTSSRDKLVTRRIIQRFLGGDKRQADLAAQIIRDMPRMLAIQAAQTEQEADMQQRQQQSAQEDTWQGVSRKIGQWWRQTVSAPLSALGSEIGRAFSQTWQRVSDKMWGAGGQVPISQSAIRGWVAAAESGDRRALATQFGTAGLTRSVMGGGFTGNASVANSDTMTQLGIGPSGVGQRGWLTPPEVQYSGTDIRRAEALSSASRGMVGGEEAKAMGYATARDWEQEKGGAAGKQLREFMQSNAMIQARLAFGEGPMSDEEKLKFRSLQLTHLRSGAAGADIARAVSTGDHGKDIAKMLSFQDEATRRGMTGDEGLASPEGGLGMLRGRELMEQVDLIREGAAQAFGGLPGQVGGITRDSMKEVAEHPDTILALKLMHDADQEKDPKKAADIRAKAQAKLNAAANNKDNGFSMGARKALAEMGSGSSIGRVVASVVGATQKSVDREGMMQVVEGRMKRLKMKLGEEGRTRLETLGEKTAIGRAATELLTTFDPGKRQAALEKLAAGAATDPKAAAEVLKLLKSAGPGSGAEDLIQTIQGMQEVGRIKTVGEGEESAATSGRGGAYRKAVGGVRQFLGGIMGISGKEAAGLAEGLVTGKEGVQEKFRKLLTDRGWKDEAISDFMKDVGGGMTSKERDKWGSRAAVGRGVSTASAEVAARKDLEDRISKIGGKDSEPLAVAKQMRDHLRNIDTKMVGGKLTNETDGKSQGDNKKKP